MSTQANANSTTEHHDIENPPLIDVGPSPRSYAPPPLPQRTVQEPISIRPTTPELQERLEREFVQTHFPTRPTSARLRASSSLAKSEKSAYLDDPRLEYLGEPKKKGKEGVLKKFFTFGGDDPGYTAPRLTHRDTSGKPKTVAERIQDTREHAAYERNKFARLATQYSLATNIAMGLQIVISALITGLSAVISGRHSQVMTSILGGLGTVVAAYIARSRVSGEPELSQKRVKQLEQFIRNCESLIDDHGNDITGKYDDHIFHLRGEFERLLGNMTDNNNGPPPGATNGTNTTATGGGGFGGGGVGALGNSDFKGGKLLPV